jgi:hypothetical protein
MIVGVETGAFFALKNANAAFFTISRVACRVGKSAKPIYRRDSVGKHGG